MAFISLLLYIIAIYIRPQEWVYPVYGWPLIDMLALSTAFFLVWQISQTKRLIVTAPQNLLLLGFLMVIALSHLSHTYFWGAYNSVIEFSKIVITFFLFVNVLDSEKKLKISIWLIVFLNVILAIQGIYQAQNYLGWAGQPLTRTGRITWVGVFSDANDLALSLVMAMGLLLAFIFGKKNLFSKITSVPLLGILLYGLYLTNSRGGYLALAGTTMFYFLRKFRNKIIALPIGILFISALFILGPSRLSMIQASEASAHGRIEAWYEGFQMLKTAPLFGVGYKMFTNQYPLTAHNSYVLVMAEEGLMGLIIWITLIYTSFKGLAVLKKKNQGTVNYISGIEASLFGFLCAVFFLSRAYQLILYVMLALAASFICLSLKKEEYVNFSKDIKVSAFLTAGILTVIWLAMKVSL